MSKKQSGRKPTSGSQPGTMKGPRDGVKSGGLPPQNPLPKQSGVSAPRKRS